MRVLVTGSRGQVGRSLLSQINNVGWSAFGVDQDQLNLLCLEEIPSRLEEIHRQFAFDLVIHPAAYTDVEMAERESDKAMLINGKAPGVLAQWCGKRKVPFIHFSTDYVFDGSGSKAWQEDDGLNPINHYGRSKAQGEKAVAELALERWMIFRTSWVFHEEGNNFPNKILALAKEKEVLEVVDDQIGAPTYAPHLAQAVLLGLRNAFAVPQFPSGIYHLCGNGETSWWGFANAVVDGWKQKGEALPLKEIKAVATQRVSGKCARPLNSRLSCAKAKKVLAVELPDWKNGVKTYLQGLSTL